MRVLPSALINVIEAFGRLPGVGPRTAERYAWHLLRIDPTEAEKLANAIGSLRAGVSYCQKTFALVDRGQALSSLYTDPSRERQLVAVVARPFDIIALENTGRYKGTYHVLGGLISPIDAIGPQQIRVKELLTRVKADKVKEVILATNASVEGEATALYVQKQLLATNPKIIITRLARGLPAGIDIEYADQITLSRALEGRTVL